MCKQPLLLRSPFLIQSDIDLYCFHKIIQYLVTYSKGIALEEYTAKAYNECMKKSSSQTMIDVPYVAQLANLPLTEKEKGKLEKELTQTLEYVATLNSIDTKNIEPTSQVTGLTNVMREDTTLPSLSQEEALSNARSTHNGFFKVPAILTNE